MRPAAPPTTPLAPTAAPASPALAFAASIAELVDAAVERKFAELAAGQRGAAHGWIDQVSSPLGRRRHIAAARRLTAAGAPGAAIVGRRHLLSADALAGELDALAVKATKAAKARQLRKAPAPAAPVDELAEYREKYGLQRAG